MDSKVATRGGTGGGTARAFAASLARLTRATMWFSLGCAVSDGPAWIRTRDQGIMSPLL
jgi:hypothetical protein